jgi:predicted O-methyltransferase YrrM
MSNKNKKGKSNSNLQETKKVTPESILEQIVKAKPESIFDVIDKEFFLKYDKYDYTLSGNCFEWYWSLAKVLKPKTFLEIGVRFGFSFLPTIQGSTEMEYALGIDLETYGNNTIANENIGKYYSGKAKWEIQHGDSQELKELPQFFDLISIDGCHDYDCKIHDLRLCIGKCDYVILDDYDYHNDVRRSTDFFLETYAEHIEWNLYIPTFRGSQLIKFKK